MSEFQWAVYEANLDPVTRAEQKGTRPVLIVSNEEFNQAMPNITVLPLTSTQRRVYTSEVFLPAETAGQPMDSIIMAHQIRTISKQQLSKHIGHLEDSEVRLEISTAIKEHLDID